MKQNIIKKKQHFEWQNLKIIDKRIKWIHSKQKLRYKCSFLVKKSKPYIS